MRQQGIEIEKARDQGDSIRSIATRLGRSPATISREIHRNAWRPSNQNASYTPYRGTGVHRVDTTAVQYRAGHADKRAAIRAANSHRPTVLVTDQSITYLVTKLRDGWTPEMIAGRVRLEFPDTPEMRMSHETMYRFIYAKHNQHRRLHEYLPRGRKKRRKHHGRKAHSSRIPHRVSIHQRPEEANTRSVFGHWEGDRVEGTKSMADGIHTEVERCTRMMFATKVSALSSWEGVDAQKRIFSSLPAAARVSTTTDNGTEMHLHTELVTALGMDTYFAHPYSSWQRGTNGRLRRYYPKRTDFSLISEQELQAVIQDINNQPRKCLGWMTPQEAFDEQLELITTDQCCTSN